MPHQQPDLSGWPTKLEAAQRVGVSHKTIERLAQDGKIEVRYRPVPGRRAEPVYNPNDLDRERDRRQPAGFVMPADAATETAKSAPAESRALALRRPSDPLAALAEHLAKLAQAFPAEDAKPTVPIAQKQWLTLAEAVEYSGLSRQTLIRLIGSKDLPYRRDGKGNAYKVRRRDLEAL